MVTAASAETKAQILDVAERAIAEYGYAGTTLRSIVSEANVNLAAVHYHFGSKEALFEALIARIAEPIVSGQLVALKALQEQSHPPSVEAILRAYVASSLACVAQSEARWPVRGQFISRCRTEPAPIQDIAAKQFEHTAELFLDVLQQALPHQSRSQLTWKLDLVIAALIRVLREAGQPEALLTGTTDEEIDTALSKLISFLLPGLVND